MAELVLQQQLVEAAKERNSISKALLAIQHTLDKMVPAISLMESVLGKLEPAVTTTDALAKAPPTRVLGTNPDTPAMDGGDIPTLTPTNCSTKGMSQSHDYVDEQPSAAAIPNTTMSELLPVTTLVPDPESMMLKDTQANTISPDASVFVCPNDKLDTAYELFDKKPLHADGDLVASVLLDTGQPIISIAIDPHQVTNQDLGAELRPRPWPSFVCRHGQERTRLPLNQAIALLLLNKHPSVEALLGCQLTSFFSSKHMMVAPGDVPGNRCKYKTQINCWFPTPVCAWMDRASLPLLEPFANSMITSIEAMELDMLFSLAAKQFLRAPYEIQRMGYAISYGNSCIVAVILLAGLAEDLSCTQYKCSPIILGRCHIIYSMAHWLESDWYYSLIFISNSLGMGLLHDDYFQVLESTFLAGQLIQCDFKLNQWSRMGQLELEMVTLVTILKGEFTSRCLQIHLSKNAQVNFPWSSCYLFLQVGKLQNVMVKLNTWPSGGWFLSVLIFSPNLHAIVWCNKLPLVDQELWMIAEYWWLDIQGLPSADAFLEYSFWPGKHIIEACLASPNHIFIGAIAVEWLYTHNSYGELTAVGNQLKGKGRVPWLIDGIGVTTSGYHLLVKNTHYPCAEIVTTRLFSSDEIKCLEACSIILHCTDNYLRVIMFEEIEPQLTVHWMKFVVQGKAIAVSNITKPTMVGTPVNHLCLEQYLVCPSHNFSSAPELILCKSGKLEFNNRISYMVEQYTESNSYMPKSSYGCLVPANTSPKIMLECSATELVSCKLSQAHAAEFYIDCSVHLRFEFSPLMVWKIAWVLGSVRTIVPYNSQCAVFTRLNGWQVMGQPSALRCISLTGKQNLKGGGVLCFWTSSSIKSTSATGTTSTLTKSVPIMTTTSTTLASLTLIKATSNMATTVKDITTALAVPWNPGINSSVSAWGQAEFQGGRNVTGTTSSTTTKEAQGRPRRPKRTASPTRGGMT